MQSFGFLTLLLLSALDFSSVYSLHGVSKTPSASVSVNLCKIPSKPQNLAVVKSLLSKINLPNQWNWLITLTKFPDRYYTSKNGVKAANWVLNQVKSLNASVSPNARLTVKAFQHKWKMQPSIIARYEAKVSSPYNSSCIIVTGSHIDTIVANDGFDPDYPNPGADDCASGSSVVFESLRTLVTSKFIPSHPLEFHWYSGEEIDLLGSKEVAASYKKSGVKLYSYLNFDQAAYVAPKSKPAIGIMLDNTSSKSTSFLRKIVKQYTSSAIVDAECGDTCSDNSPWFLNGYETAFPFEDDGWGTPYRDIVSDEGKPVDTVQTLNATHLKEFTKIALGYLVELALAA